MTTTWLRWDGRELTPATQVRALVVDSFRVAHGQVAAWEWHCDRFARQVQQMSGPGVQVSTVFASACREQFSMLPAAFPRLEWGPDGYGLLLRPAPAPATEVRLWCPPTPDSRLHPTIKGPDLALLAALRDAAVAKNCDDALIVASDGVVSECAHHGLVWWRDGILHTTSDDVPHLESITVARLLAHARRRQVVIRAAQLKVDDLAGVELWALNSLHGIRVVRQIRGPGGIVDYPASMSVESWRQALAEDH